MSRKNIFQLVEENYDIESEILKINDLFVNEYYFKNYHNVKCYTLNNLLQLYLFNKWKYRGTCLDLDEYFLRVDAKIDFNCSIVEGEIINNLEVMENLIKLYFDNSQNLYNKSHIQSYPEFESVFCNLINTLEKRMGLSKREYKDKIILYPKNAPLEKVIDLYSDEDVQWELIRYVREDLSLAEKRKSLAYLATNLYIEEDPKENNEHIKSIIRKACNILNNLHIRHNNKTGKWENKALENINDETVISLCDMVYNEMLTITLLREHKEFEKTYSEFNKKQKAIKSKKETKQTEL